MFNLKLNVSVHTERKRRNRIPVKDRPKRDMRSNKLEHAYAYIKSVVESDMIDRSAYQGQDKSVYLPYRAVSFFFGEYVWLFKDRGVPDIAGESTFRKAMNALVRVCVLFLASIRCIIMFLF